MFSGDAASLTESVAKHTDKWQKVEAFSVAELEDAETAFLTGHATYGTCQRMLFAAARMIFTGWTGPMAAVVRRGEESSSEEEEEEEENDLLDPSSPSKSVSRASASVASSKAKGCVDDERAREDAVGERPGDAREPR